jgi:chemotaxis protein MotA
MAETTAARKKSAPAPPKGAPLRPDMATIAGFLVAIGGIVGGLLLEKGSIQDVAQGTAAMIVLGGTLGAVLVTTPLPVFLRALKRFRSVLFEEASSTTATIDALIMYATKARKNGIVSLETEAAAIADPFMRKALSLAVDGTDLQEIRNMMEIDISVSEQASEAEAKVWDSAGGYSPTVGIIGAVMGLIQVMKHLEDIKEVGHGIAVAFVATVYGVGCANFFFLPAANKMRARMHNAVVLKEMTLEGVIGIAEGLNPTLIRMKLAAFDSHPDRPKKIKAVNDARINQTVADPDTSSAATASASAGTQ